MIPYYSPPMIPAPFHEGPWGLGFGNVSMVFWCDFGMEIPKSTNGKLFEVNAQKILLWKINPQKMQNGQISAHHNRRWYNFYHPISVDRFFRD